MTDWVGERVTYWEDGRILGLPGPVFVEADVDGVVVAGVMQKINNTHEAWIVTLPPNETIWNLTRIGDHTLIGHTWWEWA